ncbi:MAG: exodeoxyribonuclease V subunit alpha [Chitinophagia bacterium]|nr:exodeoxyribonuclease V subunit alpha [Chitinophagia bacterium]
METTDDIHRQFAEYFDENAIWPYAYLLSQRLTEGNICISVENMPSNLNTTPYTNAVSAKDLLKFSNLVSKEGLNTTPFILHNDRLYFQRYFKYETSIIQKLKSLIAAETTLIADRMEQLKTYLKLIQSLNANYNINGLTNKEQVDWQLVSVLQALLNNFSIITGGPGTGKTTTLAKLLIVLYELEPDAKVALAAPTGKASMRMFESLKSSTLPFSVETKSKIDKLKPSTIHGLLGYKKESVNFKYNAENPLPYNWVVVDEASMIDVPMFSKLLEALGDNCRIILLGDKDQLASVEAGSLLGDLCQTLPSLNIFSNKSATWINEFIEDSEKKIKPEFIGVQKQLLSGHIIELKFSHRFNSQGAIGKMSRAVIEGDTEKLTTLIENSAGTNVKIDHQYTPEILESFVEGYANYIQEVDIKTALKKLNERRVLVAVRQGPRGLYVTNNFIELHLRKKGLLRPDGEFYEHKPIMVTRNMHDLGLLNGDTGIMRKDDKGNLKVWFEDGLGGIKSILPAYLNYYETAFAMTIHKSQGSEFDQVIVILPEGTSNALLTRELLYTGITRARTSITIQGEMDTIRHSVESCVQRISGITGRVDQ